MTRLRTGLVGGVFVAILAALALAVGASAGDGPTSEPSGPRLAVGVVHVASEVEAELLTIGPAGEEPRTVIR
ncbi:MAG TPA: hypothetical protein VHZ54_09485, partial [Solirubrobacterales bacterium]|nr:hypothetical protein [Solirubrobacterales bacterium]